MHLLPIEVYFSLLIFLPLAVCFAKWKFGFGWRSAVVICGVVSWIYFNLFVQLAPPDQGLVGAVYFFTGWFWLLPLFSLFCIPFLLIERYARSCDYTKIGAKGFAICFGFTVIVIGWNIFGWMSEKRAIQEAREELEKRGYQVEGAEIPEYIDGNWTIRYPETEFGEIRLSKNGKMKWIGGPG